MQQAMFANAHFRGKDEPAWEAGHFTGEKSRKVAKRDPLKQFNDKLATIRANAALSWLTWAKSRKHFQAAKPHYRQSKTTTQGRTMQRHSLQLPPFKVKSHN